MALPGRGRGLGRLASLGKMLTVTARFTLFNAKKLTKSEHNALQRGATGQLRLGRAVYNISGKDALSFNDRYALITMGLSRWLWAHLVRWLTEEKPDDDVPTCDFERLSYEVRPGDAILVEGCSRVSDVIKMITQSPWTHSALYIGRLHDIESHVMRARVQTYYDGDPGAQLIVEALMDSGTVVTPLSKYRRDHLRICRPRGLSPPDAQKVISYAISQLGKDYDVRQLLDLARFMFPWSVVPRRWRSSLFQHNAGAPTRNVCSTLMAEAFMAVRFPVLPVIEHHQDGRARFYKRNPRLFAPRDFDYSPYFNIIKCPYWGRVEHAPYHQVPWSADGVVFNRKNDPLKGSPALTDDIGDNTPEPSQGKA